MDISREAAKLQPKRTLNEQLPDWLKDFKDVFEPQSFDQLPPHRPGFDHEIKLKSDAPLISPQKVYPLSPAQRQLVREFLDENLRTGRIRPSQSPYAASFFFVPKQDGKERPTQDYRWVNSWTIRDKYPLPRIETILDSLRGSKVFSKLDIRWGFNNVRIKEGDEWKAAFITEFGLWEPLIMFFSLCNSPPTFQRLMDHTFSDFLLEQWLKIYMDDQNAHHKTTEQHQSDIRRLLQRCRENKLFFRIEKCQFEIPEIDFLGIVISENSIRMNPLKTKAIHDWPVLTRKKDLQSFLGFDNYYRRFIKGFAEHALPLNHLTGSAPYEWTDECQKAYQFIKDAITSDQVLTMPNDEGQYRIECDASYYASGAVLSQEQPNSTWRPIAFASWTMTPAQQNYQIYDKEFLAVINALEE